MSKRNMLDLCKKSLFEKMGVNFLDSSKALLLYMIVSAIMCYSIFVTFISVTAFAKSNHICLWLNFRGFLSEIMAKAPSVVSRNLQRLAESCLVLKKVKGRWEITPLGVQINQRTRVYLEEQAKLLSESETSNRLKLPTIPDDSILIVINAQNGLLDATHEG